MTAGFILTDVNKFSMDEINQKLTELYNKYRDQMKKKLDEESKLSYPLLMKLDEKYAIPNQRLKLFIVGRQTKDWCGELENNERLIENLQAEYLEFMKKPENERNPPSTFWLRVKDLREGLGLEKNAYAWSNLNKMDWGGKKPGKKIEGDMLRDFSLLREEIEICKPTCIVFFTGYKFDRLLAKTFGILPDKIKEVDESEKKAFAEVQIPSIDAKCFRLEHPQGKDQETFKKYLKKIIEIMIKTPA